MYYILMVNDTAYGWYMCQLWCQPCVRETSQCMVCSAVSVLRMAGYPLIRCHCSLEIMGSVKEEGTTSYGNTTQTRMIVKIRAS